MFFRSLSDFFRADYIKHIGESYRKHYKLSAYRFSQLVSDPENYSRSQYSVTPEEFEKYLKEGKPKIGQKLSPEDKIHLKTALHDLREKSKQRYFEVVSEMPLLGYLESGAPNSEQIAKAFSKVEENLKEFLDKVKTQEDMDLLLSFEPLVEELLQASQLDDEDNSPYCLIAERARIKSEQAKEFKEKFLTGAMIAMLAPCLLSGGISISICITGEAILGTWDITKASTAAEYSLGRILTGNQFEEISKLEEKQKELRMAQWMLPLLLVEAGVVIKAGKQLRKSKKEAEK